MRAIWMLGALGWAGAAAANPQMAASNRYVCADGSLAVIEILATGPMLEWQGRSTRMSAVATLWGFKFRGDGISVRGSGKVGYRTMRISVRGAEPLDCKSVPSMAMPGVATGNVTARQRIALAPGAVLTVELRDTARADAAAPLLARTVVMPRGNQMPFWWRLDYDAKKTPHPARPALSARINDAAGRLIWINDTFTPLPVSATSAHAEAEIVLVPVRAAPSPSSK
jgi:putative lipoprotein